MKEIQCSKHATVRLVAPDGKDVPGAWCCMDHAKEIVAEYAEKLGEVWTFRPISSLHSVRCGVYGLENKSG